MTGASRYLPPRRAGRTTAEAVTVVQLCPPARLAAGAVPRKEHEQGVTKVPRMGALRPGPCPVRGAHAGSMTRSGVFRAVAAWLSRRSAVLPDGRRPLRQRVRLGTGARRSSLQLPDCKFSELDKGRAVRIVAPDSGSCPSAISLMQQGSGVFCLHRADKTLARKSRWPLPAAGHAARRGRVVIF
jgi:hypothetical protein